MSSYSAKDRERQRADYNVAERGQLTPKRLTEHRDTGIGVPTLKGDGRRLFKAQYTDLFREWGLTNSNRRYDE